MNLLEISIVLLLAVVGFLSWGIYKYRNRINDLKNALNSSALQLESLQSSFQRFAPKYVVEDIVERGISVEAERKNVTVMFADMIGFTKLSEQLDPENVVELINIYLRTGSDVITKHNGHVSKFIGDEIMALYGVPEPNPWHVTDAVKTGLAIQETLEQKNEELKERGLPAVEVGCGIHTGHAVAGVIGSNELLEYTVLGDTVNTANRIQKLTREFDGNLLISDQVASKLSDKFLMEELPVTKIRGKSEEVALYSVLSYNGQL